MHFCYIFELNLFIYNDAESGHSVDVKTGDLISFQQFSFLHGYRTALFFLDGDIFSFHQSRLWKKVFFYNPLFIHKLYVISLAILCFSVICSQSYILYLDIEIMGYFFF